jgi:tetratricopeptide (TPR) repeat protein
MDLPSVADRIERVVGRGDARGPTPERLLAEAIDARRAGESDAAVARARQAQQQLAPDSPPHLRGSIALVLGNSLADRGEFVEADEALRIAAETFLAAAFNTEFAQVQISRGRILAENNHAAEALTFFTELERLNLPDELRSQVLNNLGVLNRETGNLGEAIHFLSLDAELSERLADPYGAAVAHFNLAETLGVAQRHRERRQHAQKAAELFRASGRSDLVEKALALVE